MKKFLPFSFLIVCLFLVLGAFDGPKYTSYDNASFEAGIPDIPRPWEALIRNGIPLSPEDNSWRVPYDIEIYAIQLTSETTPGPGNGVVLLVENNPPEWGLKWSGYEKHVYAKDISEIIPANTSIGLQYLQMPDYRGFPPPKNLTCTLWYRILHD
jgi:hypothetical protein